MIAGRVSGLARLFQYASPRGATHQPRRIQPGVEEVEVIVAGRGTFLVAGDWVEVGPGSMLWFRPGDPVEVTSHSREPYNTVVFVFAAEGDETRLRPILSAWRDTLACAVWCAEMLAAYRREGSTELLALLTYTRLAWESAQGGAAPAQERPAPVAQAVAFAEAHYLDPTLQSARLAAAGGVSPSHLRLLFRQSLGVSPMRFVAALRLERACLLLRSTDLPVKRVALESGYPDANHFCRLFRQHHGMSPGRWRSQSG